MSQELHYTSAPRGLWPGSQGYCTVACTANMPRTLAERLEGLSAYRNIFAPHDSRAAQNPVVFSHVRVSIGGAPRYVLSRIGFAGLDYSGRANKYAHHVILEPPELPRGGPAWLLSQPGFVSTCWDGHVGWIETPRPVPRGDVRPHPCAAWAKTAGDGGWAGVLADAFVAGTKPVAYLIHEAGQDILPLILEAEALLPPERRWDLTFNTYVTSLPQGVVCAWRGVVRGTPEEAQARRAGQALVLDLTRRLGAAPDGPLVIQARTGRPTVGRVAVEPVPPSRPTGATQTDHEPILLHPVAAANPYGVIPELPVPPSVGSAARPRPRKTRVIVAVVCALLIAGGGLGVGMGFKHRQTTNSRRPARANSTAQQGSAQPVNRAGRSTDPSGSHVTQAQDAAPEISPTPAASAHADATATGSTVPAATTAQEVARPERAADTYAPKNDSPAGPTKSDAAAPDAKPSVRDVRWVHLREGLPPMTALGTDTAIYGGIKLSGRTKLRLLGTKDPEIAGVGISTPENAEKQVLGVFCPPSASPFARFWIDRETLHFRWAGTDSDPSAPAVQALRACVLSVSSAGEEKPSNVEYRVVLRRLLELATPPECAGAPNSYTLNWKGPDTQGPYGRRLTVSRCTLRVGRQRYATSKLSDSNQPGSSPFRERFAVAEVPRLFVVFDSEKPLLYPNRFQLKPTKEEAADHAMGNVKQIRRSLLETEVGLSKEERNNAEKLLRLWLSREKSMGEIPHRDIGNLHEIIRNLESRNQSKSNRVRTNLKNKANDLEALKNEVEMLKSKLDGLKKNGSPNAPQARNDLEKKQGEQKQAQSDRDELESQERSLKASLVQIQSALVQIGEFKDYVVLLPILGVVKSQGCKLSISLTMTVDGQPVEVARIGTSVDAAGGARISAQEKE